MVSDSAAPRATGSTSRGRLPRLLAALAGLLSIPTACAASGWLVYLGGGLQPVDGGWEERRGQVRFTLPSGMLVSVPYDDVDLAASAFITWQLGGRLQPPPRTTVSEAPAAEGTASSPCTPARAIRLLTSETLEVETAQGRETVHFACLDAPETAHKFAELGWFGRATLSAVEPELRPGAELCLTELTPPTVDAGGHRVLYVALPDGRDYTAEVIAGGLGLLRPGPCDRAASYRRLEDRAIAEQRGLWGRFGERAAIAAVEHSAAIGGGPPPRRQAGGGRG